LKWLEVHRHEEIKELITHTFHLQSQVDDLLRQDHAEILSKLDHVNAIAMDILARIEGFEAVAAKLIPESGLSDDALDLLKLFVQNGDHTMMPTPRRGLIMFSPSRKTVQYSDNRFVEDDFAALISHGLLMPDIEGNMTVYRLTRLPQACVELPRNLFPGLYASVNVAGWWQEFDERLVMQERVPANCRAGFRKILLRQVSRHHL
jgi:hypothetical protein